MPPHRRWACYLRRRRIGIAVIGAALCSVASTLPVTAALADEPPPTRSITVVFTGDVIAHVSVNNRAHVNAGRLTYDYRPMFADVQPILEAADLAVCNLEGPIAPAGSRYTGAPRFASPAPLVQSLKDVGFDRCSTATNHSNDKGPAGVDATLAAFEAAGLGASGSGRSHDEAAAQVLEVNGVRVAHLAYTFGFNGQRKFFLRSPMWINVLRADQVIADAIDARARGAEVVLVSIHWGQEFRRSITGSQRRISEAITASGQVDLVVGHHAHVLQPIKQVNGFWVIYGLGNFLSNQRKSTVGHAATQDGALARVTFTEGVGGRFVAAQPEIIPTYVLPGSFEILDVRKHLADPLLPEKTLSGLGRSWKRTTSLLGDFVPDLPTP